ncbi:gentisate 1,2-dioxygenase [Saccharospirillum impatiens]|uniref:gentisate 1,2-dioxygenase n=1 Tax=Saccharospirillum impatiens TaxID=169438 RepID=UPI0004097670|nr:gentisate 1,2-dioxygenase [Saccharospirillum impatiens]
MSLTEKPATSPERDAYYKKLDERSMSALWNVLSDIITPTPRSGCQPFKWDYDEARELLMESGGLITAKEAERRVLILENPGLRGQSRITTSLYAGLQLVLPGEVAPAHRHSQSALRFVVDGDGAYTNVAGERTLMHEGDFVITPPWAWHDHGNESDRPMVWLDGLDIPMASFFDASFAEGYGAESQPESIPRGDSLARYGSNLMPFGYEQQGLASPIFNYPYDRTREALEQMRLRNEWDPCHGLKMRYVNPLNGDDAMPTISTAMQLLPKGLVTDVYRATDATVFSVVEGHGRTTVGDTVIEWKPKDLFVVPSWAPVVHQAHDDAVLFGFSDRGVQQKLGFWREHRGG